MFQRFKIMQEDGNDSMPSGGSSRNLPTRTIFTQPENNQGVSLEELIARDNAAKAQADEAAKLRAANDARYGSGQSLSSVQDLFANRSAQGVQFQKSAADIARDLINGVSPSTASLTVNNNTNSAVQSAGNLMNTATPNDALAFRNAQMAVNAQQAQNLRNASIARSQEIANARNVIAGTGANVQGLGLTNYGNNLKVVGGLQQQADTGQTQADLANRQKQSQEQAAGIGALGAGAAAMFSDIRTKENIVKIDTLPNGLSIYQYNYKPEYLLYNLTKPGINYGVMAQEVESVYPDCVQIVNGIKSVNYSKLLKTW